jgi:phage-related protein
MRTPRKDKPLAWLRGQIKSPPFGESARIEAGYLLRRLHTGEMIGLPTSRPLPAIGARCHELRVNDAGQSWRILYRIDTDAIVIADVFSKKTRSTPRQVIETCRRRLREYDDASS